ncbi:hypothetical protein NJG17_19035 [Stenotrophomonas maltophilia]|uniref:hypothetical protein n=1 Tax=Stenotrophomonas maltophilia TaxID=40324 RepID=UPI001ED1FC85|nr:hypothetical protein [Stenotrophomonas maltophilia]MBN4996302.1 hypothetical protein [Stenotrophomonas maltophilia]MCO7501996.1 hypothetical protein [Stenotrophomonas maltophilia]
MQGEPEEPGSILAVVDAGVQRVPGKAVEQSSRAWLDSTKKPVSIIAVFIVSTKVDTHQKHRGPVEGDRTHRAIPQETRS